MTTKLEQLLEWMDSAEYAPTYGELHEKVKDLISEEQQVKNCLIADVVFSETEVCNCKEPYVKITLLKCTKCDRLNQCG